MSLRGEDAEVAQLQQCIQKVNAAMAATAAMTPTITASIRC